jgi:hypothetical protein
LDLLLKGWIFHKSFVLKPNRQVITEMWNYRKAVGDFIRHFRVSFSKRIKGIGLAFIVTVHFQVLPERHTRQEIDDQPPSQVGFAFEGIESR